MRGDSLSALDDDEAAVRVEAARSFWHLNGRPLDPYWALFEALTRSREFTESVGSALRTLEQSTGRLPETALLLCDRFIEAHGSAVADMSTGAAGNVGDVVQVVLRLRSQAATADQRRQCLDVVDNLVRVRGSGLTMLCGK